MKKTYFKGSYSDHIQSEIYLDGVEFAYDPTQVQYGLKGSNQAELVIYKKINNWLSDRPRYKAEIETITEEEMQIYNKYKNEVIKEANNTFQGKDIFGKETVKGQALID